MNAADVDNELTEVGITEMMRLTGATHRALDYWDRNEILTPAVRRSRGSGGGSRVYARWQVGRIRALVALSRLLGQGSNNLAKMIAAEPERTYHATYKEGPVTVLVKFGGSEDWGQDAD